MKTAIIYASVHHGNTKKIIDEIAKSMDSVQQLQAMNQMMKGQLNQYEVQSAMILGIAGLWCGYKSGIPNNNQKEI